MFSVRCALKWKNGQRLTPLFRRVSLFSSGKEEGHQSSTSEQRSEESQRLLNLLNEHQSKAVRLPMAEEIRTLLHQSIGYGVLSTNSQQLQGFPSGSVVGFQLNELGKPFFVFSTMSSHTKDILADSRASLVVMAKDFKGAADGRVAITGTVSKITDSSQVAQLREQYLKRHQDAYWVDFG